VQRKKIVKLVWIDFGRVVTAKQVTRLDIPDSSEIYCAKLTEILMFPEICYRFFTLHLPL